MSIRLLTAGLENEAQETRRRQHYDVARLREPQNDPVSPEPPFLSGKGRRQAPPQPAPPAQMPRPPRQINLKRRSDHNPWGVPGGIAARFGKESLQNQTEEIIEVAEIKQNQQEETPADHMIEPVSEQPEQTTEEQSQEITETAAEQTSEQDDNPSITIELQSSH